MTGKHRHVGAAAARHHRAATAETTAHHRQSPKHDHSIAATPRPTANPLAEHEKAAQTLGSSQAPATAVQPADKDKTVHAGHESAADIAKAATPKPAAPSAQTAPSETSEAPVAPDPDSHSRHAQQSDATAHEMGHGEGHDMQSMARDMRNRFWIALAFSLPVFAYSPMGMPFTLRPPFGIGLNLFLFPFASAAILYPVWPFLVAAFRAIRSGVANMAVLVILSVGTGYLFSVGATFIWGGQQFYEASAILLVFILLGHWLEMRARWGVRCNQQADESVPR